MLHRGFKHSVMKFKIKRVSFDALQNFLGVVNNQVLIRKYEIDTLFRSLREAFHTEKGNIVPSLVFRKFPLVRDDTNAHEFIDMFRLKEYFLHLFEEPADDVTWVRIKPPGTYTIHFDLTRDRRDISFFI